MSDNLNTGFPDFDDSDKEPVETRQESELILGKFKDQDELIKAYRESEKFISKTREELKYAQGQLESLNAAVPPGASEFYEDINQFLIDNDALNCADSVIEFLEQNPELLALDNKSAFSFALRNSERSKADFDTNVANYLDILPPELISGQGGELFTTPQKVPATFEEAGDLFLNMIRK